MSYNKRLGMEDGGNKSAIGETLSKVWDKMTSEREKVEEEENAEEAIEESGSEQPEGDDSEREAGEKEAREEVVEDEEEEGVGRKLDQAEFDEEDEEEDVDEIDRIEVEAPSAWPDEAKEDFSKLPAQSQEFLVNTYKGMQADYTRKLQGISDISTALDPIREECVEAGISYADALRRFVGIHKRLLKDPENALVEVAQLYGVPLENIRKTESSVDPAIDQRLSATEQRIEQSEANLQRQQAIALNNAIEEFKKTAPHFDAVEGEMAKMVRAHTAQGLPIPSIQELYERACWTIPKVREKLLAEQKTSGLKDSTEERRLKSAKAKKAARSKSKRSTESAKDQPGLENMSTRDVLSAVWDDVASR